MKINQKILSIPPYISTSWKNVLSLHLEPRDGDTLLSIGLVNGSTIDIPNLDRHCLEAIFAAHEKYLEQDPPPNSLPKELIGQGPFIAGRLPADMSSMMSIPLNLGLDVHMGNLLQHDPSAMDSPDLPPHVLEKISMFSKNIDFGDARNLPKPEPHCNCMHCQIMRSIQKTETAEIDLLPEDEVVTEEDLKFSDWDIRQSDDKLYLVTNPFNPDEHYNVFLGNPVGCTCGKSNCEHIRAVLNS